MALAEKCCVATCGSTSEILHKFPHPVKDSDRFRTWLYKVGGDILGMDNMYIYMYRKVCHLHFEAQYHTRSKVLSVNAVPTLRLPEFYYANCFYNSEFAKNLLKYAVRTSDTQLSESLSRMEITENTNQARNSVNSGSQESVPLQTPSISGQQHQNQDVLKEGPE